MTDRSATAELATLKGVAAYWELLTRHGKFLPEFSSKYITEKQLSLIQQNKVFSLTQQQVVFRCCVKPPSKLILVQKLVKYLGTHNLVSGIDMAKQNFPDKQWLILAIATVSNGEDEIFNCEYLPSTHNVRQGAIPLQLQSQIDPIFAKVPKHLLANGKGRHLKLGGLTKEEKIDEQIRRNDARMAK